MNVEKCLFCKIVKNELSCDKIYEDNEFLAFLDKQPVSKGHTLVIPKKHFKNLLDLDEKLALKYMPLLKKITDAVIKSVKAEGANIFINNGKVAGQEVFHTHFHIIPRFESDGLKVWPRSEERFFSEIIRKEITKYL